ncbi:MAG TPA: acyl-CoA dehydrogenase family protein [Stellaceae bacterium]|nr:acyl-CoA dehydrogenase family protein [Stellaceae bacterium]
MTVYDPPLATIRATLNAMAPGIAELPGCEAADPETVGAVFEEAARFAREVLAPLNAVGDKAPSRLENGVVRTPPGTQAAYRGFVEGGWNSLPFPEQWGGQALPATVAIAVGEMWNSADLAFSLCPLLTAAAVEALDRHGSPEQQRIYLPHLVSGNWTGTMNLTEPQAGSDVGAVRTRAEPDGDRWRITGQKIFITYGDHDLAENVIHLVLARTPGAPAGTRGISMFLVPKFLPDAEGRPGERNDLRVVSLEHKLGIHASPTAVMSYGDNGGAIGFLVGAENRGMENMFTMMNTARLHVGLQGIALSERAYQAARDYARNRVQGRPLVAAGEGPHPIVWHPDVRRMLLQMKSTTEAARGLAYYAAGQADRAHHAPDETARQAAQLRLDLLIPLVKAWGTDLAVENSSLAMQIHGGMGFIEETGAAQHYRDARITPIYEGTNGIQAIDLVTRKLGANGGASVWALLAELDQTVKQVEGLNDPAFGTTGQKLRDALGALERASRWLLERLATAPNRRR